MIEYKHSREEAIAMHDDTGKIKVLLVSGRVNGEHYVPGENERARRLLESTGRFEVKITEEFNGCTERTLEGYDVIFLNYDGSGSLSEYRDLPYVRWNSETEQVFFNFVKNGGGSYLHHTSVNLPADMPDEFYKIWGTMPAKVGHRWNPFTGNGYTIKLTEGTPFTKDLPKQFIVVREDFFANNVIDPKANVEVLATVYDDIELWREGWDTMTEARKVRYGAKKPEDLPNINKWQPYVWTNTYGAGRIFTCLPGNDYETWNRIPFITLLVRGVEWAVTGKITLGPPDLSGNRKYRAWPYYDNIPEDCKNLKDVNIRLSY
jgi:type 1 glutamine amidotransferase